jgi:hypothetical protein
MSNRNCLNIAIVGSRKISSEVDLTPFFSKVINAIDKNCKHTLIRLSSGLADGTDQLFTESFLNHECIEENKNKTSLGCVIAFNKNDYLQTIENKNRFNFQYEQCIHKIQLDGNYIEGDIGKQGRDKAHRQQGIALVKISDLFIVVSSLRQIELSNSVETTLNALLNDIPVIFYDLDSKEIFLFRRLEDWIYKRSKIENFDESFKELEIISSSHIKDIQIDISKSLNKCHTDSILNRIRTFLWLNYDNYFNKKHKESIIDSLKPKLNIVTEEIDSYRNQLRKQISFNQEQYRGGYLLNNILAVLAVSTALITFVFYIYLNCNENISIMKGSFLIVLAVVKISLVKLIFHNTHNISKEQFNKKAIDFRYVSERLRINYYLSFFGILKSPNPFLGIHIQNQLNQYHAEKVYDQLLFQLHTKPFELILSKERLIEISNYLIVDWLQGQLNYHRKEIIKMTKIREFLENKVGALGKCLIGIVIFEIGIIITSIFFSDPDPYYKIVHLLHMFSPVLIAITTLIPAIISSLNNINFQTEAKKFASRSNQISASISDIKQQVEKHLDFYISNKANNGSSAMELFELFSKMSEISTDEVAEWSMLYEKSVFEQ